MSDFKLLLPIVPSSSLWMVTGMLLSCGKAAHFTIALCTYSPSITAVRETLMRAECCSPGKTADRHQINPTILPQLHVVLEEFR